MPPKGPTPHLNPEVAELLAYLDDLGYHEIYLHAPAVASEPGAAREASPKLPSEAPSEPVAPALSGASATRSTLSPPLPAKEPVPASATEREAALADLGRDLQACERCGLAQGRSHVVFGSGHPQADLMLVGEGPGAEEDRTGLPFVGRAGELLTKILKAIDLTREEVYIANIVKCRPPGNRDPQPDEVSACLPFLERQIALIQPKLLVALGRVAAQTLLGNSLSISRMRGEWHSFAGTPLRVTYHPAALLRYSTYKRPTWEDMQVIRDRLQELRAASP
jgi:DNA polymerase